MYNIITPEDYRAAEAVFMTDPRALCENVIISECDCSQCPTRELCEALCAYDNR